MSAPKKAGLQDVVAGASDLCLVDGIEGRLVYCGYDIHDLVAGGATFEEVVYLLWHKRLPTAAEFEVFKAELAAAAPLPAEVMALLKGLPKTATGMEVLRTATSLLGIYDPEANEPGVEANRRKATRLTAQFPVIVAAWHRIRSGLEPVAPRADLSMAANFLYMLKGEEAAEIDVEAFNIALILHADHEFNASTFAARVTSATLTDLYSAVTSAVGALKGPLHGGANEQVMKMLQEIGSVEKAEAWVVDALEKKKLIMGFGHRVYKTDDPRATHLRRMSQELGERYGQPHWFEMSRIIEKVVHAQKGLYANVDFYSASTYFVMGIPLDLYTPIFAVSRVSGWTAHVLEQYSNNRIIRPIAEYTGPDKLPYVALADR